MPFDAQNALPSGGMNFARFSWFPAEIVPGVRAVDSPRDFFFAICAFDNGVADAKWKVVPSQRSTSRAPPMRP